MPEPGQRAHRRIGETIREKYRIDAFLATGSMANVYAATHRNGSRVALKILHRELARDPQMAERFRREGYFANAIGHPGVVKAIDDDVTEDGCAFVVLELLEGETLEDRRTRLGGKVPLAEILGIGDAMLDVLAAAHGNEVLHRDVKPDNVFLTKKGEVKILDFGVARFNDGRASSDMTSVGTVLGTPAFMPPEQALGKREEVDARSDIWGVGATLFTCIAGEAVHVGGDPKTKSIMTARTAARPLRDVAQNVPRAVASVIDRALAFDRIERWNDANAMREALRWARMSVNESRPSFPESAGELLGAPPETKRGDDEPTLAIRSPIDAAQEMGRRPSFTNERSPSGDPKRMATSIGMPSFPPAPAPLLAVASEPKPSSRDEVYTSAPPVTERGEPASEPTIGLDRDWPPDTHTELPQTPRVEDPLSSLPGGATPKASSPGAVPDAPITQRLPGTDTMVRPIDAATLERPVMRSDAPVSSDPAEIFRAALARAGGVVDTEPTDMPRLDATMAMSPAASHPSNKTVLGMGDAPVHSPQGGAPDLTPSYPPAHQAHSYPPPQHYDYAPAVPSYPPSEEHRQRNAPTNAPPTPGPLLSTIAPKREGALRKNAVLALAAVATIGITYALVAGGADDPKEKPAASASVASASAPPAASPSASAMPPPPPTASAMPSAAPSASVAAAPPPKRRRKPKPAAATSVTPAPTAGTTATAISAPDPTPEPTPPPTATPVPPVPDDTLPRKDPE